MGTFFRAIIAFLKAIILGLGALFVVSLGLCAVLVAGAGVVNAMGTGAGLVAGFFALLFMILVFINGFKASKRTSHSSQRASRPSDKKPVPPHYYRDRAQRRKQREQENNDNAN
ncbi:hypothetical protein [Kingella oralis]|jgi:hypothetical protein|uniref:hypothetical protein n=1 Tax=Kingella oralis TaxID=505 RepID=UPI002D80B387|nr:hypothetical protein [Kingella oralis]